MTLRELLDNFILDKQLQGLSKQSIKDYQNMILIFVNHLGSNTTVDMLTRSMVDKFILHYLDSKLSRNTVSTYIRNAKIFLCWIYDNYDLLFDPHKIKIPKAPKKKVRIYTDNEIVQVFNAITTTIPWITTRNKAIVSLMYDSGIRQGEVCTLKRTDIDFEQRIFKVTGKGAKERFVPLGEASVYFLEEYYRLCPYKANEYVFLARNGQPVTRNAVRLFVNKLKHKTGIDISSHKFRHNFATNYCIDNLKSCGNTHVYDLSIIMGHESIETTKRYEHFAHELVAVKNHTSHLDNILRK